MWKFLLMLVCLLNMDVIQESSSSKECGIREAAKQTRVVNGKESSEGQWPWMAYVSLGTFNGEEEYCGGSLIGKRHILTRATQLFDDERKLLDSSLIKVTLGAHNRLQGGKQYRVAKVKIHPGFNKSYADEIDDTINDVAVLILDRDVKQSKYIIPICLPDDYLREETFYGWKAYVAGWGYLNFEGERNDVLRWANVSIWRNDDCRDILKTSIRVHAIDICAGGWINQGRNICYGDIGGPLMVYDNRKWKVIGIAENFIKCGSEGHPAVFTRVTRYLDWIKKQM